MARKKVIVKNLASMQNFGSIDILCSDKTGTITSGGMKLTQYIDIEGKASERTLLFAYLNSLLQSGIKHPVHEAILQHVNQNPLDIAILSHEHPDVQQYIKIDEIPFDFLTFYVMIKIFSASGSLFQTGWFVESLATQILVIFVIRTAANPFRSRSSWPLALSVCLIVTIGVLLPFTPIASILGFVQLPFYYFIFLIMATTLYLLLVQMVKQKLMWKWFD